MSMDTPNLGGNAFYLICHALFLIPQVSLGIRYKTWGFLFGMLSGHVLEILGYTARVRMHFGNDEFLMYIVTLTIGPAFFSASIYLCLARIIAVYGETLSYFRPRTYTITFMVSDFIALILQASGGAMLSGDNPTNMKAGLAIIKTGLAAHLAAIAIFAALSAQFGYHTYRNQEEWNSRFGDLQSSRKFRRFLICLGAATLCILIRTIFRVAELSQGFDSKLANDEVSFMILEGAMIVIASICLALGHPGVAFQGLRPSPAMDPQSKDIDLASLKSLLTPDLLRGVRDFWYEHLDGGDDLILPKLEQNRRWYMGGKALDDICVERFAPTLEAIRFTGATAADIINVAQPQGPLDWLSLVLLLDQMPRNCYRGESAKLVFSVFDPLALQVALKAIVEEDIPNRNPVIRWRVAYRTWFYLPLMHSENALVHQKATGLYDRMEKDIVALASEEDGSGDGSEYCQRAREVVRKDAQAAKSYVQMNASFEKKHRDIIEEFGRYPHRNKALGRESTEAEKKYLEDGGETFGG
ncbi:hypothetical protein G7046_g142 [Stylonectria norvegica]|nr:hypothetical protein G7046_g142 [Stylonectria norvegica]